MNLSENWEFNILNINNYNGNSFKKRYYDFIRENHDHIPGDIVEVGVFKGRSTLATALLLKELGSEKIVYGFDSFEGFPGEDNPHDDPARFDEMLERGQISQDHYNKIKRSHQFLALKNKNFSSSHTVSTSDDFANTSREEIEQKMELLGLDNIRLVKGFFEDTLPGGENLPKKIMACLMDCDLYQSYNVALPAIWDRMSRGGYLYLDEYYSLKFPGARLATDDFFTGKKDKPQQHALLPGDFERWYVRKYYD